MALSLICDCVFFTTHKCHHMPRIWRGVRSKYPTETRKAAKKNCHCGLLWCLSKSLRPQNFRHGLTTSDWRRRWFRYNIFGGGIFANTNILDWLVVFKYTISGRIEKQYTPQPSCDCWCFFSLFFRVANALGRCPRTSTIERKQNSAPVVWSCSCEWRPPQLGDKSLTSQCVRYICSIK